MSSNLTRDESFATAPRRCVTSDTAMSCTVGEKSLNGVTKVFSLFTTMNLSTRPADNYTRRRHVGSDKSSLRYEIYAMLDSFGQFVPVLPRAQTS